MSTKRLIAWIDGHSHDEKPLVLKHIGDYLVVRECWTEKDGSAHEGAVHIRANLHSAREWLGY